MRAFLIGAGLVIALALGVYLGSPYYVVWRITQAAKAGDVKALAGWVDFPEVRAGLSPKLSAKMQVAIDRAKAQPQSVMDRIGLFLAPMLSGARTETASLVTPQGVTVLIKTARVPPYRNPIGEERPTDRSDPGEPAVRHEGYVGGDLDRFHARIENTLAPGPEVVLSLVRKGFLGWQVTALDLQAAPLPSH